MNTETINKALSQIRAMQPSSAAMPMSGSEACGPSKPKAESHVLNPLRTEWQRKWLRLDAYNPQVQQLADAAERFAACFYRHQESPRLMAVVGKPGCGKTHTAEALRRWASRVAVSMYPRLWPKVPRIRFFEWGEVCFLDAKQFREWLFDQNETDLIFLEDVGCEVDRFKSKEPTERFREVLNLFKRRWVFITTNVSPKQWASVWDARVADRLLRNSQLVVLEDIGSYAAH